MRKPEAIIGTGDWYDSNDGRIGIFNADYIGNFEKCMSHAKPWRLTSDTKLRFTTQEEAATYVRELLSKQEVS